MQVQIEFYNEKNEVILNEPYPSELEAQEAFVALEFIRWPSTYKGLRLNLFESPQPEIPENIEYKGKVLLVVLKDGERFERRELFRG